MSKAIVVLAIALLLCACSKKEPAADNTPESVAPSDVSSILAAENNALTIIKNGIEEKRRRDGDSAVRLLAPYQKNLGEGALGRQEFDVIKAQMDLLYLGIGSFLHRHEMDLALMQYAVSIAEKVRPLLVARIKNGQKLSPDLSVYLKETLMADFEQKAAEAIRFDQAEIEFWNAEKEKWRKSWEAKTLDYVLPQKARGQFLFDFEAGAERGESSLKNLEESLGKQLKNEIDKAIKSGAQAN